LVPAESDVKCVTICHLNKQNVNKVVFWLPYKILNRYKCTYFQKATAEKDCSDNLQRSSFLETIEVHPN
jgi:hypothetical protein